MYLQIMEQIKLRVAVGDWRPGQEIPSIRELAVSLKVSVITIKRAYMELEREGVIITRQGKGSMIADDVNLGGVLYQKKLDDHLREILKIARALDLDMHQLKERLEKINDLIEKEQL